jgi:hypothetical protein
MGTGGNQRRVNEVLKKAAVVAGAGVGLMAMAPVANADSAGNDGVNIANDNNISIAPIQICGTTITAVGPLVEVLSPNRNTCVNAPLVDHPKG